MTFEAVISSVLPNVGDAYFRYSRQSMGCVLISRDNLEGAKLKAEVKLSTLTKITQTFADETTLYGVNSLSLVELSGVGGDFPLAFAEIKAFIDAFTRSRATEALKKTLAGLETSSTEELIENFAENDLWEYLALHDEPKPSPLV